LHGRLRRRGPRFHRLGPGRHELGRGFDFNGRPDQADAEHGKPIRQRDDVCLQEQPEDKGVQGQHEGQPAARQAGRAFVRCRESQSRRDGVLQLLRDHVLTFVESSMSKLAGSSERADWLAGFPVIPAQAGIQGLLTAWVPASAGTTSAYDNSPICDCR
jgi:hypothetical protein